MTKQKDPNQYTGDTLENPAKDLAEKWDREFKRLLKKFEVTNWIYPETSEIFEDE